MNSVSIIIPMYNEELNIRECIESLAMQTNKNFDVIFIDDGSDDNTIKKLEEIISEGIELTYKVIRQNNSGAAAARKAGIEQSSTDYIMVLDCDDKLSNNSVEEMYRILDTYNDVDIIMPDMYMQNLKREWEEFIFYTKDLELNYLDCINYSLDAWKIHGFMTIKKSIINKSYDDYSQYNIHNVNYINNDEVLTRFNFSNSRTIIRSKSIYYYSYNDSSTTKKINKNKYLMIVNAFILKDFYSKNDYIKQKSYNNLIAVIWGVMIYMNKNKSKLDNLAEWRKTISDSIQKIDYKIFYSQLNVKKKMQLSILKTVNLFWMINEK